jgi:hypothetical protein
MRELEISFWNAGRPIHPTHILWPNVFLLSRKVQSEICWGLFMPGESM